MKFWSIHSYQRLLIIVGVIVLICGLVWAFVFLSQPGKSWPNQLLPLSATVSTPTGSFDVRVADTAQEQQDGLSGFSNLPPGQGMLFVFPNPDRYAFWMKDMRFPLDIVWIDDQFQVVDRVVAVSPATFPKNFIPKSPAQYVLEIPANSADSAGFVPGVSVKIFAKKLSGQ